MIEAVLFDLFGTLIRLRSDTKPYVQLCRELRVPGRLRDSLIIDAPSLTMFCRLIGRSEPAGLAEIRRDLKSDIDGVELYEDTVPTLDTLRSRNLKVAVISNLASPYKRAFDLLGLRTHVDATVFSCDVGYAKPSPEIFRLALDSLGVDASSAMMVGDSRRSDVEGATACGIRAVLLDRSRRVQERSTVGSLSEIGVLLEPELHG